MKTVIDMVQAWDGRWEAQFIAERRAKRWTRLRIAGHAAVYALILVILVATDFK
jgi:hypothetical protein